MLEHFYTRECKVKRGLCGERLAQQLTEDKLEKLDLGIRGRARLWGKSRISDFVSPGAGLNRCK